jgi:hypothetical protein
MKQIPFALILLCALAALARAQVRPEAETLFRDGKALMKDGKIAAACAAFEASEKAEHSVATVMSLGDCREKNQQYASAWVLFLQADSQTRTDASRAAWNNTAKTRAAALESRLSYLTIRVPDASRVAGLVVSRGGGAIDSAEWNQAIPVDGGTYEISGTAPGFTPWSTTVRVEPEGANQAVEVPRLSQLPKVEPVSEPGSAAVASAGALRPASIVTPRRKVAIGITAGGVVLAGIGAVLALQARSLHADAVAQCAPGACSPQDAAAANATNDRAGQRMLYANLGFAAGGAAVIAGAVLWGLGGRAADGARPRSGARGTAAVQHSRPARALVISLQLGEASGLVVGRQF